MSAAGYTVEDLTKPENQAGYKHVAMRPYRGRKPFQSQFNGATGKGKGAGYMGAWRATAEEAAQDACDYLNLGLVRSIRKQRTLAPVARERVSLSGTAKAGWPTAMREAILERDGYQCQIAAPGCGGDEYEGPMEVDHIDNSVGAMHSLENGRTVCPNCHRTHHSS